jgi:hypothetical protein
VPHPNVELGTSASDEDERNGDGRRKIRWNWADSAQDSSDTDSLVADTRTIAPHPSKKEAPNATSL